MNRRSFLSLGDDDMLQHYIYRMKANGESIIGLDDVIADIEAEPRRGGCFELQMAAIAKVCYLLLDKALDSVPRLYREYP